MVIGGLHLDSIPMLQLNRFGNIDEEIPFLGYRCGDLPPSIREGHNDIFRIEFSFLVLIHAASDPVVLNIQGIEEGWAHVALEEVNRNFDIMFDRAVLVVNIS